MKQDLLIVVLALLSCQPCVNNTNQSDVGALVDSMVILYDRQSSLIMWDQARTYRTFITRRDVPLLQMKIENPRTIALLDSCINNAEMDTIRTYRSHSPATEFLLLRFKQKAIDTVSIGNWPGYFNLRDSVYRDTTIYRVVMEELARRDSIWLNESRNGAVFYQSRFLGNTKAEIEFFRSHPI